jgi:hypothetical protein
LTQSSTCPSTFSREVESSERSTRLLFDTHTQFNDSNLYLVIG